MENVRLEELHRSVKHTRRTVSAAYGQLRATRQFLAQLDELLDELKAESPAEEAQHDRERDAETAVV